MTQQKFSIKKRIKSFIYAFNGFRVMWIEEHNFRIHILATALVLVASIIFKISTIEWLAVVFAIGFVISFEIINSAIENIADMISPEKNNKIKKIKDISAAGVLVSAITAFVIGIIIFLPKIINLF